MALENDQYGKRALDFVERLQPLRSYEDIAREIMRELNWFGYAYVTDLSIPGPNDELQDGILLNSRPREYVERYVDQNYVMRDPIVTELRYTTDAYSWGDVRARRALKKSDERIIDEAVEFGVREGLTIPIMSRSGAVSIFCPCGEDPDLTPRARSALEVIGIFSHQALQRALIRTKREAVEHTPLTPREREIIKWVASGKSDDEIADILSIATSTVTSHVENAKVKLDAYKRTYAIVQAIRFGEISV